MKFNKISKTLLLLIVVLSNFKVFSQQPSIVEKVRHANYVEIHFFKGKQSYVYKTQRKMDLTYLKTLLTNAKNDSGLKCDTTVTVVYFKDKIELAKIYLSSKGTGSRYLTGAMTFETNNNKIISLLNYGTGMLVDEEFYSLQKRK